MTSRAHARRRDRAWQRYHLRWPDLRISVGSGCGYRWWLRAHRHRPR